METTNNAQFLMTVDKTIDLGTSHLKSVTYNGGTERNSGTLGSLDPLLYSQNVIEFASSSSSSVIFNFEFSSVTHKKLIARARVYTECQSSLNPTVHMKLGNTPVSRPLTALQ